MKALFCAASLMVGGIVGGALFASMNAERFEAQDRSENAERETRRVVEVETEDGVKRYTFKDGAWQGDEPSPELLRRMRIFEKEEMKGKRSELPPSTERAEHDVLDMRIFEEEYPQPQWRMERFRDPNAPFGQESNVEMIIERSMGANQPGTFQIITAEWGMVMLDTRSGESWMLDKTNKGEFLWKPIPRPGQARLEVLPRNPMPRVPESAPRAPRERLRGGPQNPGPGFDENALRESFEESLREAGLTEEQKEQARARFEEQMKRVRKRMEGAESAPAMPAPEPRSDKADEEMTDRMQRALELEKEAAELEKRIRELSEKNESARRAAELERAERQAKEEAERREQENRRNRDRQREREPEGGAEDEY